MSPSNSKYTEKHSKKSHRNLDFYGKKAAAVVGTRKNSSCLALSQHTCKKNSKDMTRNIPKMEELESKSHYSNIMNSYSEIMSNKRKAVK